MRSFKPVSNKLDLKLDKIPLKIISQFTEKGVKFYPRDLITENKKIIPHTCSSVTFQTYHYKTLAVGVSSGILVGLFDCDCEICKK